ncbi:unnamed protein product [Caenorhabditis angaria]|uniref:ZP domain-containing protein n=1 Tax=Caenorhabditis angaria TaxID=860376 RepID=A0A9P1I599_9PELO|nr:unnamed protein product [Caenorhabditis angaria]
MLFLFLFVTLPMIASFQLDNEIVGSPKIECNPDSISFSFNTRNPFKGNVYVRGFYDRPSCRHRYDIMSNQGGMLNIRLGDCGMTRMRQLVPRGVSLHVTFVANFHPRFSTKEDRAFDVRCFYAHTDSVVKADIDVSGVPSESLEQATSVVPKCEYSLREGSLDGPRVRNTMIGVPIFHRWDCDTNGNYGILVRSCSIIDSRVSESVPFLDDNGCAISRDFPQVVYSTALNSAYTVIEALSFPDQPSIAFACQIQLCDKTSDECRGVSPPLCNNIPPKIIKTSQVVIDNRITETLDNLQVEPWMKEPTPDLLDDGESMNSSLVILSATTTVTPIFPKLAEINDEDEWAIESNQVTNREKRLADNVMDVYSNELFVRERPIRESAERLEDQNNSPICIQIETIITITLVIIIIIVLSIGTVIYLGGHFAKKRREIEDFVKEPYYIKMDEKREQMMKRLADRHEKRILKSRNQIDTDNIDLRATEKLFLVSEPKELDLKTPVKKKISNIPQTSSPIVSFDDKADQHIAALSTYVNTIIGFDMDEIDLGESKKEAYRRIKDMLSSKSTAVVEKKSGNNLQRLFEKYDPNEVTKKCRKLLIDSEIDEGITFILSKRLISVRTELAVYSDLALQTVLLHTFLSFHPAWLKSSLEAIFDTRIATSPSTVIRDLSKFIIENVFKSKKLLKNKKFAQGSGIPIVTPAGKEALHNHFLSVTLKMMFLIEKSVEMKLIPNLTRMFNRSSMYKNMDSVFSDLSKEILSGSSMTFKKALAKVGFQSSYKQTFVDDYDYTAKGFEDFSNGIILAKLIEQITLMQPNSILSKLRDPQGDRIRKLKNVEIVLEEMTKFGIDTGNIKPAHIVGCKKEQILSVLWSIIGVKVCAQKKVLTVRAPESFDERILRQCQRYGEILGVDVPDLESLQNGLLFAEAWTRFIPIVFELPQGSHTLFERVVELAENELCINRDVSNHIGLFAQTFFNNLEIVRNWHQKAMIIQNAWRNYKASKFYNIVQLVIQQHQQQSSRISNFNDATFTVSRDSVASISSFCETTFKVPKTPKAFAPVEEEKEDFDETMTSERSEEFEKSGGSLEQSGNDAEEDEIQSRISEDMEENAEKVDDFDEHESEVYQNHNIEEVSPEVEEKSENFEDPEDEKNIRSSIEAEAVPELEKSGNYAEEDELELQSQISEDMEENSEDVEDFDKQESVDNEEVSPEVEEKSENFEYPEDEKNIRNSIEALDISNEKMEISNQPEVETPNFSEVPVRDSQEEHLEPTTSQNMHSECSLLRESLKQQEEILEQERIFHEQMLLAEKKRIEASQKHMNIYSGIKLEDEQVENVEPSTPELREILRAKRKIAAEQRKIAEKLRRIEQSLVFDAKNEAMIESIEEKEDREIAGNESMEQEEEEVIITPVENEENPESDELLLNSAAIMIQKCYRGYLTRRKIHEEIQAMRQKVEEYNRKVGGENQEFHTATASEKQAKIVEKQESARIRLQKHAIRGLPNDNLTVVLLSATTIDRLTSLLPCLTDSFVLEFDGIRKIYEILMVADRGYSYSSILVPLIKILLRIVKNSNPEMEAKVCELLNVLSPRLLALALAHKPMFHDLISILVEIARKYPNSQRHFTNIDFYLKRFSALATHENSKKLVANLRKLCENGKQIHVK